jgi:hypothetical protein
VSETRKLGFDPDDRFFMNEGRVGSKVIHNPTDTERVELAIAALTHGTGRWLPDVLAPENTTVEYQTRVVLIALADLRAALARDAAAKEAEREREEREVEDRRKAWADLWLAGPTSPEHSVNDWPEWLAKLGVEVPSQLPPWQNRPGADDRGRCTEGCHDEATQ